ncbi:hypothetical protein J1N35_023896 [Gossypium stocksii]|uniref:DUF4283 domain-containing protein n=1 Tax=Gossypium stocksii TaxID=47602 RepID=A0A9D3VIY4_9ROSI|nr:hypothetical protein J1N35_023896 [Gossypium stocksii]
MDNENKYFLAKFQNCEDFEKVFSKGQIIYGLYLTVKLWSVHFNPTRPFPSMVMSWICLPGLSGHIYNWKVLWKIRMMVGKVVKLNLNTTNGARGRFARMAVYVNLHDLLVSQVWINGVLQRV